MLTKEEIQKKKWHIYKKEQLSSCENQNYLLCIDRFLKEDFEKIYGINEWIQEMRSEIHNWEEK